MNTVIITNTSAANIIMANNTDMERASFMVAKTNGNINPILLGAKVAMISELKKVTWPTFGKVMAQTGVVLVVVLCFLVVIGAFDAGLTELLKLLLPDSQVG